ncbi:MAG: penicillin-binding transpeptidase domain-containing protein [Lachnospiraceae bacterium]|nr:penicillin-binding transpeptidase domain-containing protein [Lachnospiraceae bacterium]
MFDKMKHRFSRALNSRIIILAVVIALLAGILVQRLFQLQIIQGETYQNDFSLSIKKERQVSSARGNIYDKNGVPIAYNELSYCVVFEDSGTYESTHEKNLAVNSILYRIIKMIESHGDSVVDDFEIELAADGSYVYNVSGFTLLRFKADLFGQAYTDKLTDEQRDITAEALMKRLCDDEHYGLLDPTITAAEREEYQLPESYTDHELLQLVGLRADIAANSFQRYQSVTIARNISQDTMAQIQENMADFPGIDITEEYRRVYANAESLAPLIGYTGKISQEELEELQEENEDYDANDIVGKTGLEKVMETTLQGTKGSELLSVDNLGRTLAVENRVEPIAGEDLILTIDSELQNTIYQLLEQYIAGIVYKNLVPEKEINEEWYSSADDVRIPIYDVYYALFENNVLDVGHLKTESATENEKYVYNQFLVKASDIFATIKNQLLTDDPIPYKDLTEEYKVYMSYIVNDMLMEDTGILNSEAIDKTDETYLAWTKEETISLQEYLTYAISKNWIDITRISEDAAYMDSAEVYTMIADYIADYLYEDNDFCKKVYRYMLQQEIITGAQICLLLFDQGVLEMDADDYERLSNGSLGGFEFMQEKIFNLEIKPSQLALNPCSASFVMTDPNTGKILACVTYPGYDNNRLANEMDTAYYRKLNDDKSSPFYSRATMETIAPGSTFKPISAVAGIMEGVINYGEGIYCTGAFTELPKDINCWNLYGHGTETVTTAIRDSCNYFFNTVGWRLSQVGGEYNDEVGTETLSKYAAMFGLDAKSGIEVPESSPHMFTADPVRGAMGQSDNAFTTTQIARYVTTIANSGTCYDLTLIDKIKDSSGSVLEENTAKIHNEVELPAELWNTVHTGMRDVVRNHKAFSGFTEVTVAGKTGTAQQSTKVPNHGLFIGYAPYEDPEIAIAVRITNGYNSTNAAMVARDVISYYYGLEDKDTLITGHAATNVLEDYTRTD